VLQFNPLKQPTGPGVIDAGGRIGRDFAPSGRTRSCRCSGAVAAHVKARLAEGPVVIASYSDGSRERMEHLLEEEGTGRRSRHGLQPRRAVGGCTSRSGRWSMGSRRRAYGDLGAGRAGRPADPADAQEEEGGQLPHGGNALTPGDLVVHVDHGVGRYLGLGGAAGAGTAHECLALEYAENTKLYLPVENIELLSRFGHEEGLLDKLGAGGVAGAARRGSRLRLKLAPSG
jgi:transcription-repair coupling factor (superfamily II helicase)